MIAEFIVDPGDLKSIVKNLRKYGEIANLSECQGGQLALFRPVVAG